MTKNAFSPSAAMMVSFFIVLAGCAERSDAPLDRQIQDIVTSAHESGKFQGNVLVTRKDRVVYEGSFGEADRENAQLNTAATRFLVFSVLKPLTAVLVFQQVDAGKLRLEDTLASFFPNLTGKPAGALTLQQLLTHTSGINEVISEHRDRRITAGDLETATVQPDGGFEYSNTGYVCLALVLEARTQRPYEALLREQIFDPAEMKDSGLVRSGSAVPGLSHGYRLQGGNPVPVSLDVPMEALDGAGSLYTTARDLWRFDRALAAEKILSRRMQDLMLTQQIAGKYGYGWFLSEQGGKYYPWHKGDYRGHVAIFARQIHRDEVVVILSNQEEADVLDLRTKILRALKASPAAF